MLKNDLKIDLKIQNVFNYDSIEESKFTFEEQLWYLLNKPRFDGQEDIVKEIEWLFFTSNDDYVMVGVRGDEVWAMDGDGELTNSDSNLPNMPFKIFDRLLRDMSIRVKDLLLNFLYYFNYCEKNNIELLAENLLWKKQIQDFLDNNQ